MALGHLAAGVSHEIRNPLSSIKGLAKYFSERAPAGGEAHQLAQVMANEADRLNRVVSELLEMVKPTHLALLAVELNTLISQSVLLVSQDANSRESPVRFTATAGGEAHQLAQVMAKEADRLNRVVSELLELVKPTHLALQAVELNTLISHSLQLVSQDANSREIQLRFTANDTLPEIQADPDRLTQVLLNHSLQLVSQDANSREIQLRFTANDTLPEIQADPDRLTQVLLNLYLNAIQAIGQHGVISVTASESGAGVKISVTDSGKGIAADQLEAIFTPYFTTKAEGTGGKPGCKQPGDPVTLYRQRHITGNSGRSGQADSGPVESLSQRYSGDWSAWRD